MNILITTESLSPEVGGPYYTINSIAGVLARRGHAVSVAYIDIYKDKNRMLAEGVEEFVMPGIRWRGIRQNFSLSYKRRLVQIIREKSIDILIDNGIWLFNNHASVVAANNTGIPLVVAPRGLLEVGALKHRMWKKRIAWYLYQKRDLEKVDMFHACSQKEMDSIRKAGFNQPIALVPNGVEIPEETAFKSDEKNDIESPRTALFLSRLHKTKGVIELVHSWARVRPVGWRLQIAGSGSESYRLRVKALIEKLGLSHVINLVGPLYGNEKSEAFCSAELFLLPTYTENFGVVIAEAMSYGLPVITTTGAPWQKIRELGIGWWIDLNEEDLDQALAEATEADYGVLISMGARGREYVRESFSWSSCGERLEQFLNSLKNAK